MSFHEWQLSLLSLALGFYLNGTAFSLAVHFPKVLLVIMKAKSCDITKSCIKPLANHIWKKTQSVLPLFFRKDHRKPKIMFKNWPVDPSLSKKSRAKTFREMIEVINAHHA